MDEGSLKRQYTCLVKAVEDLEGRGLKITHLKPSCVEVNLDTAEAKLILTEDMIDSSE